MQKMISFNNTTTFDIPNKTKIKKWLCAILTEESFSLGELNFLFCDDHHLHQLNVEFLNHNTLTDILTFDYNVGQEVTVIFVFLLTALLRMRKTSTLAP
jgi:ssRNA-specific RNase YbeY (16S rRNA maturation enzyme)